MNKGISIREWINNFNAGNYEHNEVKTQCEAGWFDWFCQNTSLASKTRKMGKIIKQLQDGGKINLDSECIFFKNNCPIIGPLYDVIAIKDRESEKTMLVIELRKYQGKNCYKIFGRKSLIDNGRWESPIFTATSSKELINWLNTPWSILY